jgi:hypothetical protein
MKKVEERFFFDKDQSSHWYMIPLSLLEIWQDFTSDDFDEDDVKACNKFEKLFGKYRIGGHPSQFSFSSPKSIYD